MPSEGQASSRNMTPEEEVALPLNPYGEGSSRSVRRNGVRGRDQEDSGSDTGFDGEQSMAGLGIIGLNNGSKGKEKEDKARLHVASQVRNVLTDESTSIDTKVGFLTDLVTSTSRNLSDIEKHAIALERENRELTDIVKGLTDMNDSVFAEANAARAQVQEMKDAFEHVLTSGTGNGAEPHLEGEATAQSFLEMYQRHLNLIQNYRTQIDTHNSQIDALQANLTGARLTIDELRESMAQQATYNDEWIGYVVTYAQWLSAENQRLRSQLEDLRDNAGEGRVIDVDRWVHAVGDYNNDEHAVRLPYGTLDRDIPDADDGDVNLPERPDAYRSPFGIRMRRRLARPRLRVKRAGSSKRRTARPSGWRIRLSETNAAQSYLIDRKSEDEERSSDVLKDRGRRDYISKPLSRKRWRLSNRDEILKRVQAVCEVRQLPPLPSRLGPWCSVNPYDRKYDQELAKLMEKFSMRDEPEDTGVQADIPVDARIVTIKQSVDQYIPREKIYTTPRYLPKEPAPLSRDERRASAQAARNWRLGPGSNKSKKKVRFAKDVQYEPDRTDPDDGPETEITAFPLNKPVNWKNLLIIILLILVWISNTGEHHEKQSWITANRNPDDLIAKLQSTGLNEGGRTVTVMDFEFARWSDIHPGVVG